MSEGGKTRTTAKPADISFDDWKKMKSALNSSAADSQNTKESGKTYNSKSRTRRNDRPGPGPAQNMNDLNRSLDYRKQQQLQYFEFLKQRQLVNQMLVMQAFKSDGGRQTNQMGAFNQNRGFYQNTNNSSSNHNPFHTNQKMIRSPFNNNMEFFNHNMAFNHNKNAIRPYGQPFLNPNVSSGNKHGNRTFSDNYMHKNANSFSMAMLQQPFKMASDIPPLMSIRVQKCTSNINNTNNIKKTNNAKPKKTNKQTQQTNGAKGSSVNSTATTAATTAASSLSSSSTKTNKSSSTALPPEAYEAKQKMWREYRQLMKPYKNKDFLNAKRVIQRLKKKPYEQLDERERARWEKANKFINSHKKMLAEKAEARGQVATLRAERVQDALLNEKDDSNVDSSAAQIPSETDPVIPSVLSPPSKTDASSNAHSRAEPTESAVITCDYELWNSFVPGGVLFKGS